MINPNRVQKDQLIDQLIAANQVRKSKEIEYLKENDPKEKIKRLNELAKAQREEDGIILSFKACVPEEDLSRQRRWSGGRLVAVSRQG